MDKPSSITYDDVDNFIQIMRDRVNDRELSDTDMEEVTNIAEEVYSSPQHNSITVSNAIQEVLISHEDCGEIIEEVLKCLPEHIQDEVFSAIETDIYERIID